MDDDVNADRSADDDVRGARRPDAAGDSGAAKHLKVLERAGLITRTRSAQLRPSRLQGAPLEEAAEWLERDRRFWQAGFDRLDERLQAPGQERGL